MPNIPQLGQSILSQPIDEPISLDRASGEQPLSLSDIAGGRDTQPLPPPIPNDAEATNFSSAVAALSGNQEDVIKTYLDVDNELKTTGVSPTANSIMDGVYKDWNEGNYASMRSILADPNIPNSVKNDAIKYMAQAHKSTPHPMTIVAEKAAASYEPKTDDEGVSHFNVIDNFNSFMDSRQKIQDEYNKLAIQHNGKMFDSISHGLKTIGYIFIPGMRGSVSAKVYNELKANPDKVFNYAQGVALPGTLNQKLVDYARGLPNDVIVDAHKIIFEALNSTDLNIVTNDNAFAIMKQAREIVTDGYTDHEKYLDNLFGLIDIAVVLAPGKVLTMGTKITKALPSGEEAVKALKIKGQIDQKSLGVVYEDTNPDKFRDAASAAIDSPEAAKALFNSDSHTVAAHYTLPSITDSDKGFSIVSKSPVHDPLYNAAKEELMSIFSGTAGLGLSKDERAQAAISRIERMQQVENVVPRVGEFNWVVQPDGSVRIHGNYGTISGGWADPEVALNTVKQSLRHLGLPDSAFTVNAKNTTYYKSLPKTRKGATQFNKQGVVDTSKGEGGKATTYTVSVDDHYIYNSADVKDFEVPDVKHNYFSGDSSLVGEQFNIGRLIFPWTSMFDKTIQGGASNAVNMSSRMEAVLTKVAESSLSKLSKLSRREKTEVMEELNKINITQVRPDIHDLKARGFSDEQIDALNDVGHVQDISWHASNLDAVDHNIKAGKKVITNDSGETFMTAKPVHEKNPVINQRVKALDLETGAIRNVDPEEIKAAYTKGGGLAEVEEGVMVGEDAADYVIVNGSNHYMRDLRYSDQLVGYKVGYAPTKYTDPVFIIKQYVDKDGMLNPKYDRAVAVVGNSAAAQKAIAKLQRDNPEAKFARRYGRDKQDISTANFRDNGSLGRHSTQKIRGQRLSSVDDKYDLTEKTASVMNPVDATLSNIRSLSNRIGTRPYLESQKARFMQSYEEFLKPNRFGRKEYPSSIQELADRTLGGDPKKLADARLMYQYIRSLEKGTVNLMDKSLQGILLAGGRAFGEKAFKEAGRNAGLAFKYGYLENKFIAASQAMKPLETMRSLAFHSFLTTFPMRQFAIQGHQALQVIIAYHPRVWRKTGLGTSFLSLRHMGYAKPGSATHTKMMKQFNMSEAEVENFYQQFIRSGLVANIANHNMVSSSIRGLTESSMSEGLLAKSVMAVPRAMAKYGKKYGFDPGEFVAKATGWTAEYADRAYKAGWKHNFKHSDYESMANAADNLTSNMNNAGEMLYNKNILSMFMQFQQAPHKAIMSITHRQLTARQKSAIVASNAVLYGVPSTFVYTWLKDNGYSTTAEATRGAEDLILNKLWSYGVAGLDLLADKPEEFKRDLENNAGIDFQGTFVPYQSNIVSMWADLLTSGLMAYDKAPSLSLWVGANPRIGKLIEDLTMFTGVFKQPLDQVVDGSVILRDLADLSNGTSHLFKGWLMLNGHAKTDSSGKVLLDNPTVGQSLAQMLFGIGTHAEKDIYAATDIRLSAQKNYKADIEKVVKNMYSKMSRSDIKFDEAKLTLTALAVMRDFCKNDSACYNEFSQQMKYHINGGYVGNAFRLVGMMPAQAITAQLRASVANASDQEKASMEDMIQSILNAEQEPFGDNED